MAVTNSEEDSTITEAKLSSIANQRRREILALLHQQDVPTDCRTLAEQVAAAERDTTPNELSEETIEEVMLSLHHTHLPKLEDTGFLVYDPQQNQISPRSECETPDAILPAI